MALFKLEKNHRLARRLALWWKLALEEAGGYPNWRPILENVYQGAEVIVPGDKILPRIWAWLKEIPGWQSTQDTRGPPVLLSQLGAEEEAAFLRTRGPNDPLRDYAEFAVPKCTKKVGQR